MTSTMVIFGASGDLTRRKLIPALFRLHQKRRLPAASRVVGVSRSRYSDDEWRSRMAESTAAAEGDSFDEGQWNEFASRLFYQPGDLLNAADLKKLDERIRGWEQDQESERVYYLSTAPSLYEPAVRHLGELGMASESSGSRRLVVEKPFGTDLASSQALNAVIHESFHEGQVYRIDHYLGKETVQNLLVLRFANSIFEPIWNRNYVDHVQITVAEEVDVADRGAYYDKSGVLRDMFQNHLLQLMAITAMEAPTRFEADDVRNEKVKLLRAIRAPETESVRSCSVRGQYRGYRDIDGVSDDSQTATFASLRLQVDNWRWNGVPFYLRSGKAMSCRTTQIVIQFRLPPHMLFGPSTRMEANRLVIQVQPAEGIQLHFLTKVPDAGMRFRMTDLDFSFRREFRGSMPDAYQRLLLDALQGDASLFIRGDEVEWAWRVIDPVIQGWQSPLAPPLEIYELDFWGPECSTDWMREQGREWFDVCPVLH